MMITWWKDCHKCWNEKTAAGWRGILKTSDTLLWRKKMSFIIRFFELMELIENKIKYTPHPTRKKNLLGAHLLERHMMLRMFPRRPKLPQINISTPRIQNLREGVRYSIRRIFSANFLPITWRNPNNFLLFSKHHLNRRFSTLSLATLSRLSRNFANFIYDIMTPQIIWIFSWLCK